MLKLTEREPRKVYLERFVFMAALLIPSVFLQGVRTAFVAVMSVLACMIMDALCCALRRIRYDFKDASMLFWGLAAAMMMPSTIPVGLIWLSAAVCVGIGKHLFGSSDNIIFCPPAISTAFLIICYPADMLYYPRYGEKAELFSQFSGTLSRSVEYSLNLHAIPSQSFGDLIMGLVPGAIGAVYVGVILVCGICMAARRSNSFFVAFPCLFTAGLLAFFFPRAGTSGLNSVVYELTSGYLVFGTVFLAAEPYRIPQKTAGKILYGIMLGYITMMFRFFGQTEGCFVFALLILGALSSSFDRVVENIIYWKKTYLNTFEKSKTQIQGGTLKLTDTQEIELPAKYRYNTPPIDSKVTRVRRQRNKLGEEAPPQNAQTQVPTPSEPLKTEGSQTARYEERTEEQSEAQRDSVVERLRRSRMDMSETDGEDPFKTLNEEDGK